MKLHELKDQMREFLYLEEDSGVIDIAMGANISTRMDFGNPIWLIVIGPSSGGKSQIIRPFSLCGEGRDQFVHRVDDLTENTLLSGTRLSEDAVKSGKTTSLLHQIGSRGIILISDLTTIFSKGQETKNAILGQLRLVYDGEYTKRFGNNPDPVTWKGSIGVIAGSTPSIYTHFEDVADMGERFIYYRMKPVDPMQATVKAQQNVLYGAKLDNAIAGLYQTYLQSVLESCVGKDIPNLSEQVQSRITQMSLFAARMRTPVHVDHFTGEVDRIPTPEMPMRVALQLKTIAQGLSLMQYHETGSWEPCNEFLYSLEWCAWSLANEERRMILKTLAQGTYMAEFRTQQVADVVGISTGAANRQLQQLTAIGFVSRQSRGDDGGGQLTWKIVDERVYDQVSYFCGITRSEEFG